MILDPAFYREVHLFPDIPFFSYTRAGSFNSDATADAKNHQQCLMIDAGDSLVVQESPRDLRDF